VRLDGVGKRYGLRQPWVVRDVTRAVAAGQLIRLEGPNGSGKSTLLRIAAGAATPSAGQVTGRPRTGYVPERFPPALAFPARDYLRHMARIHGLSGPAGPIAVEEWLERLGAAEYAGAPLRTLSKGMCQKIAIAQALLAKPGLLVLDEAWTGLDQAARGALDTAVAERLAAGGTVMFVDHDPARLAGQVDERWRLAAGGQVTTVPGAAAAGGTASGAAAGLTAAVGNGAPGVVIIELAGLEAGSLRQAGLLPGVRAVWPELGPDAEPAGRLDLVRLTVTEADSDRLLRELLSWDGVHVAGVTGGPGTGSNGSRSDGTGSDGTGSEGTGSDGTGSGGTGSAGSGGVEAGQ
jgi:ABC-2 type transport system ATP-binding protein